MSSLADAIGQASAVAQGLHAPVTSAARLVAAPDQTCYVAVEGRSALGFIKVGRRQLFIAHGGSLRELPNPLVVLDFFVAASVRRRGLGRILFDAMCSMEDVSSPAELAYVSEHRLHFCIVTGPLAAPFQPSFAGSPVRHVPRLPPPSF